IPCEVCELGVELSVASARVIFTLLKTSPVRTLLSLLSFLGLLGNFPFGPIAHSRELRLENDRSTACSMAGFDKMGSLAVVQDTVKLSMSSPTTRIEVVTLLFRV